MAKVQISENGNGQISRLLTVLV